MLTIAGGIVIGWIVIRLISGWASAPRALSAAELRQLTRDHDDLNR